MSKLDGSDDIGSYLINLVEGKEMVTPDIAEGLASSISPIEVTTPDVAQAATSNGNESNGITENSMMTLPAPGKPFMSNEGVPFETKTEAASGTSDS